LVGAFFALLHEHTAANGLDLFIAGSSGREERCLPGFRLNLFLSAILQVSGGATVSFRIIPARSVDTVDFSAAILATQMT
jgi:hypothetical protein